MNERDIEPFAAERIRVSAEFVISGTNLAPDDITGALGIQPDSVQRLGDDIRDSRTGTVVGVRRMHRWALRSGFRTSSKDLGDHLRVLLDAVLPRRDVIADLASTNRVWFWVFFESDAMMRGTGMVLSAAICYDVASLGAELDFDLYCSLTHAEEIELP